MQAKLIAIGNSRGVRLPKAILQAAGIEDEVTLRVTDGSLVITPARRRRKPREGWAEAIDAEIKRNGPPSIDSEWEALPSDWDEAGWT
jgi:antitoxin MazE